MKRRPARRPLYDSSSLDTDYYKLLGISPTATEAEIKRAYHAAAKRAHPDAGGSQEQMQRINEAYQALSSAQKRREYDAHRSAPPPPPRPRQPQPHYSSEEGYPARPHREPPPNPAAHAHSRAAFNKLRRGQARGVALQMLLRNLAAAALVVLITHFFGSMTSANLTRHMLSLFTFIPVYFVCMALVFLVDPDLRLEIFDLTHDPSLRTKLHLLRILIALALPFLPLAVLWVWLAPI
jgi:hypothetical protein